MADMIQVRNVPKSTYAELARQAEEAGLSLNRFLLGEFERIARRGRNADIFRRAAKRGGKRVSSEDIVKALRAERDR